MTHVRDVMQRDVVTLSPDMSVREVAQTLVREGIGGAPVTEEDGTVLGVVSARDVMRAAAHEPDVDVAFEGDTPRSAFTVPSLIGDALDERTALEIMTPAAFSVRPDLPLRELAEFLVRGQIHRALVLEGERLIGIVTSFDLLRVLAGIDEHH